MCWRKRRNGNHTLRDLEQKEERISLLDDLPKEQINEDKLNVSHYSARMAKLILDRKKLAGCINSGFVVGIQGSWGSGKTTFANFMKREIEIEAGKDNEKRRFKCTKSQRKYYRFIWTTLRKTRYLYRKEIHLINRNRKEEFQIRKNWYFDRLSFISDILHRVYDEDEIKVLEFNPWWFSGHQDLTYSFFDQLEKELNMTYPGLQNAFTKYSGAIAEFSKSTQKVVALARQFIPEQKTVPELKKDLEGFLKDQDKQIIVFIDDIDRLSPSEICQIFRLVKSVADLPTITYVLTFDLHVVVQAITQEFHIPGQDYLDKIIQLPVEIPIPERGAIFSMVVEGLAEIIGTTPEDLKQIMLDRRYELLAPLLELIRTPRDAIRFSNAIHINYPLVLDDVDIGDFLSIELLRIFCPELHQIIKDHQFDFTEDLMDIVRDDVFQPHLTGTFEYLGIIFNTNNPKEVEVLKAMLSAMFPKYERFILNTKIESNVDQYISTIDKLGKARRISHSLVFSRYFRYGLSRGDISHSKIKSIVNTVPDKDTFRSSFRELLLTSGGEKNLETNYLLSALTEGIDNNIEVRDYPNIAFSLLGLGEFLDIENQSSAEVIVARLVCRFTDPERFADLKKELGETKFLALASDIVSDLDEYRVSIERLRTHDDKAYLTEEQITELKDIILQRIRSGVTNNSLLGEKQLARLLFLWKKWSGDQEMIAWTTSLAGNPKAQLSIISAFISTISSGELMLQLDVVKEYLPIDFAEMAKSLENGIENQKLSMEEMRTAQVLIKACKMKEKGIDTNIMVLAKT